MSCLTCLPCHVSPCIMSHHVSHVMSHMSVMSCLTCLSCHVSPCLPCHVSPCIMSYHLSHVMFQHFLHFMLCLTAIMPNMLSLMCHVSPCFMSWINDIYMLIDPTGSKEESSFLDCRFPVIMYLGLADQLSDTKQQNSQARISTMSGLISIPSFWASWPHIDMLFGFHFCHSWFLSWQII